MTDEQSKALTATAKFGTTALESTTKFGTFLAHVFGTVPEDTVGLLVGDWLHQVRIRNLNQLESRTETILSERGVQREETQEVSPNVAIPILENAKDESRADMQDIWAKLLARAMDPNNSHTVSTKLIEIVSKFDPADALVFQKLWIPEKGGSGDGRGKYVVEHSWREKLPLTNDEIDISFQNLADLNCVRLLATKHVHTTTHPIEFPTHETDFRLEVTLLPLGRALRLAIG